MSRTIALAVLVLAFVVALAGCGAGPGLNETSGGGFAAALGLPLPTACDKYAGGDEALDEAGNVLPADVAATSPLKLWLVGGEAKKWYDAGGVWGYPMKVGESRQIKCTFNGSAVTQDPPPVWSTGGWSGGDSGAVFNAMALPPITLADNIVVVHVGVASWVKVRYHGYVKKVWVVPEGTWTPAGQTATLNAAGARLKVTGATSQWTTQTLDGFRLFAPKQSGELTLRGTIVPTGSYPSAPAPTWTANQSRLKFVSSATGWNIKFSIKKSGDSWLTAQIDDFAVTVLISK